MKNLFILFICAFSSEFKNMKLCCSQSLDHSCSSYYPCVGINTTVQNNVNSVINSFNKFIHTNNKQYNSIEEYAYRLTIYSHNKLQHSNTSQLISPFADWTKEEFYNYQRLLPARRKSAPRRTPQTTLPYSIDWRKKDVVANIKDQGLCGSCWTFATVASIESATAIFNQKPVIPLSEQNLIDCVKNDTIHDEKCCLGCNGGVMDNAFDYIIKKQHGLIDTEESYPYMGFEGNCKFSKKGSGAKIINWIDIPSGDEYALAEAVANVGPVSVTVDASSQWQFYDTGILIPKRIFGCSSKPINANHGVVIVGYGSENNIDYWIVRNSWGTDWGESGYLRLVRGINACGVANSASYPIISTV
ncbi:MAG: hypothetical protein CML47_11105 [Rhodobacteraceae bacterium]|jgi:C1A family cysteine protease|nr:MAG: hypothetical protein CML47_11105 [Paracoccaceae bacterium]|tara:strand:- start:228 stop:1304 length:1077 start_codon:yes stop_codon:yes gene_type:complete